MVNHGNFSIVIKYTGIHKAWTLMFKTQFKLCFTLMTIIIRFIQWQKQINLMEIESNLQSNLSKPKLKKQLTATVNNAVNDSGLLNNLVHPDKSEILELQWS